MFGSKTSGTASEGTSSDARPASAPVKVKEPDFIPNAKDDDLPF
jgi:hypothetical protein